MGKIKHALYRFFYGRYGTDTLNKTLTFIYLGLFVVNAIVSLFVDLPILTLIDFVLSAGRRIAVFSRMLSRNIVARRRENEKFCGFFRLRRNQFRDRKTHIYKKCPQCRAVLRLPKAKGRQRLKAATPLFAPVASIGSLWGDNLVYEKYFMRGFFEKKPLKLPKKLSNIISFQSKAKEK